MAVSNMLFLVSVIFPRSGAAVDVCGHDNTAIYIGWPVTYATAVFPLRMILRGS